VGFFRVNCKEIATLLAGKYLMLSKGLIDVMAKRVKNTTLKLYDEIQEVKLKINEPPKDIEKLTEVKEYMQQVPITLEKMKQEIEKSMAVYELMEPFKYKFLPEDIQKRWLVFSGPKEILELIE
jgi:dynein heavy chain